MLKGNIGSKAKNLKYLIENGFNVPPAIFIDADIFKNSVEFDKVTSIMNNLTEKNIESSSLILQQIINNCDKKLIKDQILNFIDEDKLYAVRSSGVQEDLEDFSFAGIYHSSINVKHIDNIVSAVIECYNSLYSQRALAYHLKTGLTNDEYKMAVIVQEMVNPKYSGVIFSVNPLKTNDREMLIEMVEGYGEDLVSGLVTPYSTELSWFGEVNDWIINKELVNKLRENTLQIQQMYGFPVDIEFCIDTDVKIVQVRPITNFNFTSFDVVWTNANFRDGLGKKKATPLMNSLYECIWDYSYKKFIKSLNLIKDIDKHDTYNIHMASAYWNLSSVKTGMSQIIGYNERLFDKELGIAPTYEGDGTITKANLKTIFKAINVLMKFKKEETDFESIKESEFDKYINKYYDYTTNLTNNCDTSSSLYFLLKYDYFTVESTYYRLIFLNTIRLSLYQDFVLKYYNESEYLNVISNINDISHLRHYNELIELTSKIIKDQKSYNFWNENSIDEIYSSNTTDYYLNEFYKIVEKYGYHSEHELDITNPSYIENYKPLIYFVKDYLKNAQNESNLDAYAKLMQSTKDKYSDKIYNKIKVKNDKIRDNLWWREEYKDLSTRYYHLIRQYCIKYANELVELKILNNVEDIWYLEINDILNYIDGNIDNTMFKQIINNNKIYYNSYKNFIVPTELGNNEINIISSNSSLTGVGCSFGITTGEVCVISEQDDYSKIKNECIVIAKNLDPNFISKINLIKGIITESGGLLCHYAVVAREVNIPCITNVSNVVSKLNDGDIVELDGSTGSISIVEESTK